MHALQSCAMSKSSLYFCRKAHTESAKKWLEVLEDKSVPVLVCLTYGDKLYAECMGNNCSHPDPQKIKLKIAEETEVSTMACVSVTGHYSNVCGLIQLVISPGCFIEITPDFLCPFMND